MAKFVACVSSLIVLVLLVPIIATGDVEGAKSKPAKSGAEWTLAIYLDSDNDLGLWAQKDMDEMMMVGSTDAVNVIVFWDTYTGPGRVYKVLKNGLEELRDCKLNAVEPNMGDPTTLRAFAMYAFESFPAKQRALMCWDHGDDCRGLMFDHHIPDAGFDLLTHQEVAMALAGLKINVLIYAACIMSTIEVVYEYFASELDIDYYVANEGYDPMDGFPLEVVMAKLVAQPSMSSLAFSEMLVDEYTYYYEYVGTAYSQSVTLSVVQVNKAGIVTADFQSMVAALMIDVEGYAKIVSDGRGRANLPWSENGWERLVDLTTFVKTVHDESLSPQLVKDIDPLVVSAVVSSSERVLAGLSDLVVYHRNINTMENKGCHGMAIYFPTSLGSYENCKWIYGSVYDSMRFAQEGWLDFLHAYWYVSDD